MTAQPPEPGPAVDPAAVEIAARELLDSWPWLKNCWERDNGLLDAGGRELPTRPFERAIRAYLEHSW